jgi:hypothetical protein
MHAIGLSRPLATTVPDALRRLLASQSQDFSGAKWSLGMRVPGATDASLDALYDAGTILRTHVLRPTWHFVLPEDIRWLVRLTAPRIHAASGTMYRRLGLTAKVLARAHRAMQGALEESPFLTRQELATAMIRAGVKPAAGQRLTYLVMHAELELLLCSGPRRGKQFTYALVDARAPSAGPALDRRDALSRLAQRYFPARGPSTAADLAKWAGLTLTDARLAAESVGGQLRPGLVDGVEYLEAESVGPDRPARGHTHLLSIYDEYISSYRDRRTLISPEHGKLIVQRGAAVSHAIVVNGRIIGTWSRTFGRDQVALRLEPFGRLDAADRTAIEGAARRYGAFFGLPVRIS